MREKVWTLFRLEVYAPGPPEEAEKVLLDALAGADVEIVRHDAVFEVTKRGS